MLFLYIGSAEDTVKRPLARYLKGALARPHYGLRADQSPHLVKRELKARMASSGGQLLIAADLTNESFERSLGPVLAMLTDAYDENASEEVQSCEVVASVSSAFESEELFSSILRTCPIGKRPLHIRYYILTPWCVLKDALF